MIQISSFILIYSGLNILVAQQCVIEPKVSAINPVLFERDQNGGWYYVDWSYFFYNSDPVACPVSSCSLKSVGCTSNFVSSVDPSISISSNRIRIETDKSDNSWRQRFCFSCTFSTSPATTVTYDDFIMEQLDKDQNMPNCYGQVQNKDPAYGDLTVPFDISQPTFVNVGSGFRDFFQGTVSCPITSCSFRQLDCSLSLVSSNMQIGLSSPWQISSKRNNLNGYSEKVCIRCSTNDGSKIYKIWTHTQQVSCSPQLAAAGTVLANQIIAFDETATSMVDYGSGYSSFFQTLDPINCPISSCGLHDSSTCSAEYNDANLVMGLSSPWQISSYINVIAGHSHIVCVKCFASDGTHISKQWSFTQTQLDCTNALTQQAISPNVIPYVNSPGQVNVGSGFSSFFAHNQPLCPVQSCQLGVENACASSYIPTYISLSSVSPWQITATQNVLNGYSESFCLRCTFNNGASVVDQLSVKVTQDPIICSSALVSKAILPYKHQYLSSTATVSIGIGFNTFFDHNPLECPIQSCSLGVENDCSTPFSSTNIQLGTVSPWFLTAQQNLIAGYNERFCLRCTFDGGISFADQPSIQIMQDPLDCSSSFTKVNAFDLGFQVSYNPNITSKISLGGYETFFKTTDQLNCPVLTCQLFNNDCLTPYSGTSYFLMNLASPWSLQAKQNIVLGYIAQACYKCSTPDMITLTQRIQYIQDKLVCPIQLKNETAEHLIYNSLSSNYKIEKEEYNQWFFLDQKSIDLGCQIVEYGLFFDSDCKLPSPYSQIVLQNERIELVITKPTDQTFRTYLCAKSITNETTSRPIDFDICGKESISIDKSMGERLFFEYRIADNKNEQIIVAREELLRHFISSNPQCPVEKLNLVTQNKQSYSSEMAYLDSNSNFILKIESELEDIIYLEASTTLGSNSPLYPLNLKIKRTQKVQDVIYNAPYFIKKPQDITLTLNNSKSNFEIQLPQVLDDNGDNFTIIGVDLPKQVSIEGDKVILKDISEQGVFKIKLSPTDVFGRSKQYEFTIKIVKEESPIEKYLESINNGTFDEEECIIDLCQQSRICLVCTIQSSVLNASWPYNKESHNRWKGHSRENFQKFAEPVRMQITDFTINGVLKIEFNQKLVVPHFVQSLYGKRHLVDLSDLNVEKDIMDIKINWKDEPNEFKLQVVNWNDRQLDIKLNFMEPLLISRRDIDFVECKVINPFLFVSEESGGHLTDHSELMSTFMPKQLPADIDGISVQSAAELLEKAQKWILISQLIAQILLKGSLEQFLSLYYALQTICYIYNIYEIKSMYPSNAEMMNTQLTNLIEFRTLQPEPLIQLFNKDFKLDEFISGVKQTMRRTPQEKSLFSQFQLYIFIVIIILALLIIAALLIKCYKDKIITVITKVKEKLVWNGLIRMYQMNFLKTLVNPVALILVGQGNLANNWIMILTMIALACYSTYILYKYHEEIVEERSGLLLKDLKYGENYWMYFPLFLLRRILFILIPLIFESLVFQLISLVALSIGTIIVYGYIQPHVFKERTKIELINESFILMFIYNIVCFTDFNLSYYSQFIMGFSCWGLLAALIIINLGNILLGQASRATRMYVRYKQSKKKEEVKEVQKENEKINKQDQMSKESNQDKQQKQELPMKAKKRKFKRISMKREKIIHVDKKDVISEHSISQEESKEKENLDVTFGSVENDGKIQKKLRGVQKRQGSKKNLQFQQIQDVNNQVIQILNNNVEKKRKIFSWQVTKNQSLTKEKLSKGHPNIFLRSKYVNSKFSIRSKRKTTRSTIENQDRASFQSWKNS